MSRDFSFGKLFRCGKTTTIKSDLPEPEHGNEEEKEKLKVKLNNNEQSI